MNYALVENGVVVNVIYLHPMNADDFPNAVPIGAIPVAIGDNYENGTFYRDGEKVLTAFERNQAEKDDMKAALATLGVTVNE